MPLHCRKMRDLHNARTIRSLTFVIYAYTKQVDNHSIDNN